MNGVERIALERREHFQKHPYTLDYDLRMNADDRKILIRAAQYLIIPDDAIDKWGREDFIRKHRPEGWDLKAWTKMVNKPYGERLVIAGSLIAAQYDIEMGLKIMKRAPTFSEGEE